MFIRAIWRGEREPNIPQTLREVNLPDGHKSDSLGLAGADFRMMIRGLFD